MEEGWIVTGIEPNEGARSSALKREIHAFTGKEELRAANSGQFDAITLCTFWNM